MSLWRPSPDEERWLEVAARLGAAVPRDAVAAAHRRLAQHRPARAHRALRAGARGGRARCSGSSVSGTTSTLLAAGLISAGAAEWLTVGKRLHASGIEEGLCVAGFLMIGAWIVTLFEPRYGLIEARFPTLVLIAAGGAAGLRLLNPFVTTCAVLAFVNWVGSSRGRARARPVRWHRHGGSSSSAAPSRRLRSHWAHASTAGRRTTACSTGWS